MPVCKACRNFVVEGGKCSTCGLAGIEMTAVVAGHQSAAAATPLRPVGRTPVARLIVIDDDSDLAGECFRLRRPETSIGRRACNVTIDQDADMSSCHAYVVREEAPPGNWKWQLRDAKSTNGTFVRVTEMMLVDGTRFRVGGVPCSWREDLSKDQLELIRHGNRDTRFRIRAKKQLVIGSESADVDLAMIDATIDSRHAKLQKSNNVWSLFDMGSRNGLWRSVATHPLASGDQFLCGQQRFRIEIPGVSGERDA
ncbi:FHA domain-containing protein [Rhodopirellula europaea]|uniref:FHA domain-containing protein n=1 Tax=Rhodopirellula europaea TaxID=1263866 RepID=UPI003D2AF321